MLEQPSPAQRNDPLVRENEQAPTNDSEGLATKFCRYGYRCIIALLGFAATSCDTITLGNP